MRSLTLPSAILGLHVLTGCALDAQPPEGDQRDDSFLSDGKADGGGITEGSPKALGVLRVVNEVDAATLRTEAGVTTAAATRIESHRAGADGQLGTADDDLFDSLAELDAVPYVGPVTFQRLVEYAGYLGFIPQLHYEVAVKATAPYVLTKIHSGRSALPLHDGEALLVTNTWMPATATRPAGGFGLAVTRLTSEGGLRWHEVIELGGYRDASAISLLERDDGSFTAAIVMTNYARSSDLVMLRFDANGSNVRSSRVVDGLYAFGSVGLIAGPNETVDVAWGSNLSGGSRCVNLARVADDDSVVSSRRICGYGTASIEPQQLVRDGDTLLLGYRGTYENGQSERAGVARIADGFDVEGAIEFRVGGQLDATRPQVDAYVTGLATTSTGRVLVGVSEKVYTPVPYDEKGAAWTIELTPDLAYETRTRAALGWHHGDAAVFRADGSSIHLGPAGLAAHRGAENEWHTDAYSYGAPGGELAFTAADNLLITRGGAATDLDRVFLASVPSSPGECYTERTEPAPFAMVVNPSPTATTLIYAPEPALTTLPVVPRVLGAGVEVQYQSTCR